MPLPESSPTLSAPHPATIHDPVFAAARHAFIEAGQTLANVRRDFPEWHLGRPHYALWALDVDLAEVRQAVAAASAHLADLLLDNYRRQPHVTVGLCGFPAATAQHADDFDAAALAAQLVRLSELAPAPFELRIGQLASFSSVPFLAVGDPDGAVGRLRHALGGHRTGDPGGPYVPHVTVGLYAGRWPTAAILPRLDAFAAPALHCRIARISLMRYAAAEIGGPLTTLAEFDLAHRRLEWHARPAVWHTPG